MTSATSPSSSRLAELPVARRNAVIAECEQAAALADVELATRLLADTPTHEARDPELLRRWARVAIDFGAGIAGNRYDLPTKIVERGGGLDRRLLARYRTRPESTVELYTDALALGEDLTALLGWHEWFPPGSLRATALAHEEAHCRLHDAGVRRALRRRLVHTSLRLGRFRVLGHVAGTGEIAAHGYAAAAVGLVRSPMLLTVALTSAVQALGKN